ncbi:MAG: hypothetical protein WCH99_10180 [Verrucomicrobiota bacterium]
MTSLIPQTQLAEYLQLPEDVRADVARWLGELQNIVRPIEQNLAAAARRLGVSVKTARRKYDVWRKSNDWRALVNRSKVPTRRGLDDEFVDYWKKLCEQNGRKCRPAFRELRRRWQRGDHIPGLDNSLPRHALPFGCTYDNLIRHKPTKFELVAARIGRSAAADFRPLVFTTRLGLNVGQFITFDDMWHDFKVVAAGQRRAMRLLQLHAHDIFSGCQFARGVKPRLEDEATGKSVGLKEDEMLFLAAHVLGTFGYRADGCTFLVEHGTAALNETIEKVLLDLTGGKLTVSRSGIEGASAFAGQYAGRSKGNFRLKASLESLGNLIHNETANLIQFPGQTGSNSRVNLPEELHGRERASDGLIKAMLALPADRAALLKLPFLEVNQARWLVEEIMERINRRTDHELEGWEEAGLTTVDYEVPGVGLLTGAAVMELEELRRNAVLAAASPIARKLSPREVFDNGARCLVKFRPEQIAALLHTKTGREVKVGDDRVIEFLDESISPAPLKFLAHHLPVGERYEVVVNPFSPQTAHYFDARGAWLGVLDAWQKVRRDDVAGLHAQMGRAAKIEKELLAPLAARGAEITRQRIADAQSNSRVMTDEVQSQASAERLAKDALG